MRKQRRAGHCSAARLFTVVASPRAFRFAGIPFITLTVHTVRSIHWGHSMFRPSHFIPCFIPYIHYSSFHLLSFMYFIQSLSVRYLQVSSFISLTAHSSFTFSTFPSVPLVHSPYRYNIREVIRSCHTACVPFTSLTFAVQSLSQLR